MKKIEVVSYNPMWPEMFQKEAAVIKKALGDHLIAIHHVGSTSVPGLPAKPKIDIVAAVNNPKDTISSLEAIGYTYKGEWNIPFKYGFTKRDGLNVNLHVFEEGHPEIALNLLFRDFLRENPNACDEYAKLKEELIMEESSHQKSEHSLFYGYNLGKDAFIRKVLKQLNYRRLRFLRCGHHHEWDAVRKLLKENVRNYQMTFLPDDTHFILCEGVDVIGYAHLKNRDVQLLVMDLAHKRHKSQFLSLLERWLSE